VNPHGSEHDWIAIIAQANVEGTPEPNNPNAQAKEEDS
jgi:hypothetical protein